MIPVPAPTTDPKMPDQELVARVEARDEAAFRLLMRRYNQKLFRTARAILRDDADAEDALQEAYLQVWRSIGGFRHDAKLSTWLVRIVVNVALARLRKLRRGAEIIPIDSDVDGDTLANVVDPSSPAPELETLRGEARRIIERKIDELPASFRTVFVMREIEEMTVEEAAHALDIPEATVRTRLFRAKALLRASLAAEIDVAIDGAFSFDGERCDRIVENVMSRLHTP